MAAAFTAVRSKVVAAASVRATMASRLVRVIAFPAGWVWKEGYVGWSVGGLRAVSVNSFSTLKSSKLKLPHVLMKLLSDPNGSWACSVRIQQSHATRMN